MRLDDPGLGRDDRLAGDAAARGTLRLGQLRRILARLVQDGLGLVGLDDPGLGYTHGRGGDFTIDRA